MPDLSTESILFLLGMLIGYCGAVLIPRQAETRGEAILLLYLCTAFGWAIMLSTAIILDYGQGKTWIKSPFSLCLGMLVIVAGTESIVHRFPRQRK